MDTFEEETVKVPFERKHLDAVLCAPASVRDVHTAVVLTHGAGGDMNFTHLVSLAHALASHGFVCLRFTCKGLNLAYRVRAYRAVWDYLISLQKFIIQHVFVGGRSMGCRAAAALARQLVDHADDSPRGVICLSFPLHPPGQTHAHRQRSEDLRGLPEHMSVLFVSGTEDNMCDRGSIGSMAGEPWNRVNIPFPSAVSSVRIHFSATTDANVKALLMENEKVLKLIQSKLLQTEIRVLYELLYILNNSYRGNKTFKSLEQVEQCINRLKNMKLSVALKELTDLCPNRIQRGLSIKIGKCDVPSQPMLEWLCLKLLGAAQLMTCTLSRCNKAFILTRQQMKWEEFVILNMVITSMLGRLWVIFRAVLVSLSTLYQQLLKLLREVACAQPMPFLKDFSLPEDMSQFLHPSDTFALVKQAKRDSPAKGLNKGKQHRMTSSVKVKNQGQSLKIKEDLGVAVERDRALYADMKPFHKVFKEFTEGKSFPRETNKAGKRKQKFKKQARDATTFREMAAHLEEMIIWCKSEGMEKEKRLLTFLRLKGQKMTSLEAAGYNVQKKLRTFRHEAHWASTLQGSVPRSLSFSAAVRRNAHLRARFHSLKTRFKSSIVKAGVKKKHLKRRRKSQLPVSGLSDHSQRRKTKHAASPQTTVCDSHDDIDDIFSSIGL